MGTQSLEKNHTHYWLCQRLEFSDQKKLTMWDKFWDDMDLCMLCMHFRQNIWGVTKKKEKLDHWRLWLKTVQSTVGLFGWPGGLAFVSRWERVKANASQRVQRKALEGAWAHHRVIKYLLSWTVDLASSQNSSSRASQGQAQAYKIGKLGPLQLIYIPKLDSIGWR